MNLQVLQPSKTSIATFVFTTIRFFSRVDSHVCQKFVLGVEWLQFPLARLPLTRELLTSFSMFDVVKIYMLHQLAFLQKLFLAGFPFTGKNSRFWYVLTGFFFNGGVGCVGANIEIIADCAWQVCKWRLDRTEGWVILTDGVLVRVVIGGWLAARVVEVSRG